MVKQTHARIDKMKGAIGIESSLRNTAEREWDRIHLHLKHHFMRMHLIGVPSAPAIRGCKQCTLYIPAGTLSSFRPSTSMISCRIAKHQCSLLIKEIY